MIDIQTYIDKLELLKEWINKKIDHDDTVSKVLEIFKETGMLYSSIDTGMEVSFDKFYKMNTNGHICP